MHGGEAANTSFIIYGLTRPGIKSTIYPRGIYRTPGVHANHYRKNCGFLIISIYNTDVFLYTAFCHMTAYIQEIVKRRR